MSHFASFGASPTDADRLPAPQGMRLGNFLSSNCKIGRAWDSPWVTLPQNVTKVQLPHLYLRNLTVASQTLDWLLEA